MKTQWKVLFYKGELFESAEIDNLTLKFNFKAKYKKNANYASINQMLQMLWNATPILKDKFVSPTKNASFPCMKLKAKHGYQDGAAALAELQALAKPKKNIKKVHKAVVKEKAVVQEKPIVEMKPVVQEKAIVQEKAPVIQEKAAVQEKPTKIETANEHFRAFAQEFNLDFDLYFGEIDLNYLAPGEELPSFEDFKMPKDKGLFLSKELEKPKESAPVVAQVPVVKIKMRPSLLSNFPKK